jgi:hypothetical protein
MGGMHVDCDYECLKNIEPLLIEGKECCIATEPQTRCDMFNIRNLLNSALLASVPKSRYIRKVIEKIFSENTIRYDRSDKIRCILDTTGPFMLSGVYESLPEEEKKLIYLIPAKYVTPFDVEQIKHFKPGSENVEQYNCLKEAYAIHYFSNTWISE